MSKVIKFKANYKAMKKIILILALVSYAICINGQGGWHPTPNNPNKWYWINKDTIIKGVSINQFAVCVNNVIVRYQEFAVDSNNNIIGDPHHTIIWFDEYFNKDARIDGNAEINKLNSFFLEFDGLPFIGVGDGDISISPIVKQELSEHYNINIYQITE